MLNIVGRHLGRRLGLTHATHIRCYHPITRRRQRADLPMPTEPKVRKAVAQHHRHSHPLLHVVHVDTVDCGVMVLPVHRLIESPKVLVGTLTRTHQ